MEAALTLEALERRRHERVSAEDAGWRQVRLRTGDPLDVIDIGEGGALVESARRLLPGQSVVVLAVVDERPVSLAAVVTRCFVCALEEGQGVRYRGALAFAPKPVWYDKLSYHAEDESGVDAGGQPGGSRR